MCVWVGVCGGVYVKSRFIALLSQSAHVSALPIISEYPQSHTNLEVNL